jgi:hypothetical protein
MALGVAPIVSNAPIMFPWPGASADLDFVRRQYFWNGATRLESDFTALTLNGATFGAQGLDFSTCTINPVITLALAAKLNITMPPCVYAVAGYFLSTPGASKGFVQFDDATDNERFWALMTATPQINVQTVDGAVVQSTQFPGPIGVSSTARFGFCFSADTNDVKAAGNGTGATADTAATMPTVTQLQIGKRNGPTTWPPAIISRMWIFTAVKNQADVNQLSTQIRDTP